MNEVIENGSAYLRRQMAYASSLAYHHNGSWDEIGFEPAKCIRDTNKTNVKEFCHTKYFSYSGTRGIDFPRSGVEMKLLDSLRGCPAGSYWEAFVFKGEPKIHEPDNINCIKLLPNFKDIINNYSKAPNPVEIASILQPSFSALFYDLKFDFSDSTVANLWQGTYFSALTDSTLQASKINEIERILTSPRMSSILKNIHEQTSYQDSIEGCTEECAKKIAKLIGEANFHETEWFRIEEIPAYMEILFQRIHVGMRFTLKKKLNGCPAGSYWEGNLVADLGNTSAYAHKVGKLHNGESKNNLCQEIRIPENEACSRLTPYIRTLNTCDTNFWDSLLQAYRAQMLSDHRDSVDHYKVFYKDSIRKQEIADSILFHTRNELCEKESKNKDSCFFINLKNIKWSSIDIEKYNFREPLNIREVFREMQH